jgi:hypothetical protein
VRWSNLTAQSLSFWYLLPVATGVAGCRKSS